MNGVVFDPDARAEFLEAVEYYEHCQPGLGRHFRNVVETELLHICSMPFRFRSIHAHFRRCLIPKFPYAIFFSIEPEYILVMAVAHVKRKPGFWYDRIG